MSLYTTGIRPLIDEYLKQQEFSEYPDYWRGSSAGQCYRYVIMKRLGVTPVAERMEDAARTTRVFEAGHIFHEWLQRITKGASISVASEVEIKDDRIDVVGHFDDLIIFQERDENNQRVGSPRVVLYDYKTANSMSFNYADVYKKMHQGASKPMSDLHRMQLATYVFMLRQNGLELADLSGRGFDDRDALQPLIRNLSEARILTVEKDTLRMREQQLIYTPELQKEVVGYWRTLQAYWLKYNQTGALPECTCHIADDGWFARRTKKGKIYNDYFYNDVPCSQEWFDAWKAQQLTEEKV